MTKIIILLNEIFRRQQVQLDSLRIPADNGVVIKVNGAIGLFVGVHVWILILFALASLSVL